MRSTARRFIPSATRRACAPSWRSRSIRRSSEVAASMAWPRVSVSCWTRLARSASVPRASSVRRCAPIVRGTSHAPNARNALASAPASNAADRLSTGTAPNITAGPEPPASDAQLAAIMNPRTAKAASAIGTRSAAILGHRATTMRAARTAATVHGRTPNTVRPIRDTGTRRTAQRLASIHARRSGASMSARARRRASVRGKSHSPSVSSSRPSGTRSRPRHGPRSAGTKPFLMGPGRSTGPAGPGFRWTMVGGGPPLNRRHESCPAMPAGGASMTAGRAGFPGRTR